MGGLEIDDDDISFSDLPLDSSNPFAHILDGLCVATYTPHDLGTIWCFDGANPRAIAKRPSRVSALAFADQLYDAFAQSIAKTTDNTSLVKRINPTYALAVFKGELYDAGRSRAICKTLSDPNGKTPVAHAEYPITALGANEQELFYAQTLTSWKNSFDPYDLVISSSVFSVQKDDFRCNRDYVITSLAFAKGKLYEAGEGGKLFDLENIFEDPIHSRKRPIVSLCVNNGVLVGADASGALFLPLTHEKIYTFYAELTAMTSASVD